MRILKNKLILVILLLVFLSILLVGVGKIKDAMEDNVHKAKCKSSVKSYSTLIEKGIPARVDKIDCPAKEITLKKGKAKEQIANQMYHCYDNYGRGKLNLFVNEGLFCSVCSIMSPKEDLKIDGFYEYLLNNTIPGKNITYFEFLQHHERFDAEKLDNYKELVRKETAKEGVHELSSDKNYAVIFSHAKGKQHIKQLLRQGKYVGAGALGVVTGVVVGGAISLIPVPGARPVGIAVGASIATGSGAATFAGLQITKSADFRSLSKVYFRSYTEKTLKEDLQCTHIPVSTVENG